MWAVLKPTGGALYGPAAHSASLPLYPLQVLTINLAKLMASTDTFGRWDKLTFKVETQARPKWLLLPIIKP